MITNGKEKSTSLPCMAYMSIGISDLVRMKSVEGESYKAHVVGPQLYHEIDFVFQSMGTKGTFDLVRLL